MIRPFFLALPAVLVAAAAAAQAPAVRVDHPFARATAPHASVGVAYMTLTSPTGDRLLGASSPAADHASVHEMAMDGPVMRMRPVAGLDLPAGRPVTLAPGGYHLMLEGLHAPLVAGQTVAVRLSFEHAPPQEVAVPVERAGARSATPAGGQPDRGGK